MGCLKMAKANTNQRACNYLVFLFSLYTLFSILEYSLSHVRPPKPLLAHTSVLFVTQNSLAYHASLSGHLLLGHLVPPTYP